MASNAVLNKAAISVPFSNLIFMNFQAPGGQQEMGSKIVPKTGSRRGKASNGRWTLFLFLNPFWERFLTPCPFFRA